VHGYVKRRPPAEPGSIPVALDMFRAEVRFYREIAPVAGVRVPACYQAEVTDEGGTVLVLEDLSAWQPGADPAAAARLLAGMHRRWEGQAACRARGLDTAGGRCGFAPGGAGSALPRPQSRAPVP
jgi:fructosamine-3-kinase